MYNVEKQSETTGRSSERDGTEHTHSHIHTLTHTLTHSHTHTLTLLTLTLISTSVLLGWLSVCVGVSVWVLYVCVSVCVNVQGTGPGSGRFVSRQKAGRTRAHSACDDADDAVRCRATPARCPRPSSAAAGATLADRRTKRINDGVCN